MANSTFSDNFCLYLTHSTLTVKNPNVKVSMIINHCTIRKDPQLEASQTQLGDLTDTWTSAI